MQKYAGPLGPSVLFEDLSRQAWLALPNETAAGQFWIFALLALGLGIKMAIMPLHTWLPSTYMAAHPTTTALLAAVGVEAGNLRLPSLDVAAGTCSLFRIRPNLPWFFGSDCDRLRCFGSLGSNRFATVVCLCEVSVTSLYLDWPLLVNAGRDRGGRLADVQSRHHNRRFVLSRQ